MVMLVTEALDGATVERAGALVACEQAAARRVRPELPAAFGSPDVCTAVLQRLCDSGSTAWSRPRTGARWRSWPRRPGRTLLWAGLLSCWPKGSPSTGPGRSDRGSRRRIRRSRGAADRRRCAALLPAARRAVPPVRGAVEPRVRTPQRLRHPAGRAAGIKTAGGAGGARTHDRRIMSPLL